MDTGWGLDPEIAFPHERGRTERTHEGATATRLDQGRSRTDGQILVEWHQRKIGKRFAVDCEVLF